MPPRIKTTPRNQLTPFLDTPKMPTQTRRNNPMLLNQFMSHLEWLIYLVVALLIALSITEWTIIFHKIFQFMRIRRQLYIANIQSFEMPPQPEKYLMALATIASISPYIGLFGTVIGIMHALSQLPFYSGQIMSILPGLAEALITTALGLFVAIPAVIAYNHLLSWKMELSTQATDINEA